MGRSSLDLMRGRWDEEEAESGKVGSVMVGILSLNKNNSFIHYVKKSYTLKNAYTFIKQIIKM